MGMVHRKAKEFPAAATKKADADAPANFHAGKEKLSGFTEPFSLLHDVFSCASIICIRFKGSKPSGLLSGL